MNTLERSILRTVSWFSLFDAPVTAFEIWKWMLAPDRPYGLEDVYGALETSGWLRERVGRVDGWYAPLGAMPTPERARRLVAVRQERFLDALRKYAKLRRAAWFFAAVPTVEGVAVGNTLAWRNTRPDSDIDLFVVARPGTAWLTRLFLVSPFALLRRRPGGSGADPFCFSFFVTSEALDLSGLRLPGGDPYLAYWTRSLVPVVDQGGTFARFQRANDAWARGVLPHAVPKGADMALGKRGAKRHVRFRVRAAAALERAAGAFQRRRLPPRIRERMNRDSRVVVTDTVLKFHDNDRRAQYRDRLNAL